MYIRENYNIDTICVQSGYEPKNGEPRVVPIVQYTTFKYESSKQMGDLFDLKEYLGIDVPNDKLGILQDVHWSDGNFGYFPTYALGTAFAAQYVHAMKNDLDGDNLLENNKFDVVKNWLRKNIHTYGFRYEAPELMKMVTGEEFNVNYFLDYIEDKYTKLYHL